MGESKGRTLHEILEAGTPLTLEQAVPLVVELANVLEARHKQGKILGGIYPDQVLFEDGMVQLFELAAPRLPEDLTLQYLGFVPPEVLEEQAAVSQTDIYSMGIILYALLTGHVPYVSESSGQLIDDIRQGKLEEFPRLANFTQIEWIIKKCLIKVPSRRFVSAQDVAQELRKAFKPTRPRGEPVPLSKGTGARRLQKRGPDYKKLALQYWKYAAGAAALIVIVPVVVMLIPEKREVDRSTKTWRINRLSITPDVERDAAPSPDAKTIAFVSNMTGNWDLYIRSAGPGIATQLTDSPGKESDPRWSPDGELILFTYEGPGIEPTLFSIPPSGGIPQKLVDNAVEGQWSPDGKKVCYVTPATPGVRNLEVRDIKAMATQSIVKDIQGLSNPSFSHDEKEIVCEADSNQGHRLFIVNVESGKMKPVGDVEGNTPTWDWKTGWIYYESRTGGKSKIWRTDPDGFKQEVTSGEGKDFNPIPAAATGSITFYREGLMRDIFSISPDASSGVQVSPVPGESSYPRSISNGSIAFVRMQDGQTRLEAATISTKGVAVILDPFLPGAAVSVSSDGSLIHAENPQDGKKGLWEIAISSGQQVGLGEQLLLPYEMSPDRKWLFYASKSGQETRYLLKDLKTQADTEVLVLPAEKRILRAFWVDRGNAIAYLTPDRGLSVYSIKKATTSNILDSCYDFAVRPRAEQIAALAGSDPKRNSLVLMDMRTLRRRILTTFDPESYSNTIDWSRDGKLIYYDRMKTSSEMYSAE